MRIVHIETHARFDKRYRKLLKRIKESAKEKEKIFRIDPFHPSLNAHKLHGEEKDAWAFSIDQKYRIKFLFLNDNSVLFLDIGTHDNVYR